MSQITFVALIMSAMFGASGQLLFKLGATDRATFLDYLNVPIVGGFLCYGIGAVLWIFALSQAPLALVYPFTALTFVLVYLAAAFLFGETISIRALAGIILVLFGLFLIYSSDRGP